VFEWQAAAPVEKKLRYEAETSTPIVEKFVAHQIDARERAQRWVKAVEEAAALPENSEIVAKLNAAAIEAMNDPAVRKKFEELGLQMPPENKLAPEALGLLQKAEIAKWWPMIRAADVKVE